MLILKQKILKSTIGFVLKGILIKIGRYILIVYKWLIFIKIDLISPLKTIIFLLLQLWRNYCFRYPSSASYISLGIWIMVPKQTQSSWIFVVDTEVHHSDFPSRKDSLPSYEEWYQWTTSVIRNYKVYLDCREPPCPRLCLFPGSSVMEQGGITKTWPSLLNSGDCDGKYLLQISPWVG